MILFFRGWQRKTATPKNASEPISAEEPRIKSGFFRGRRRKAGLVTLVLACALMAAWTRSLVIADCIEINLLGHRHRYFSTEAMILCCVGDGSWSFYFDHLARTRTYSGSSYGTVHCAAMIRHYCREEKNAISMTIPYWSIVMPLTLISAWLLLSNPRAKKPSVVPAAPKP